MTRHNGLLPVLTCYGRRTCCRLVMDTTGKSPTCYGLAMGKLV